MTQLDNQVGIADEVTYGTRVAPTVFFDFDTESIKRQQSNRVSAGLRKGQKVQRSDHQSQALVGAQGPLAFDVAGEAFSKILKHIMGAAPTIVAKGTGPVANEMTYLLGDGVGLSFTTQIGRPGVGGTVEPFDYTGCKVMDATFTQAMDAYLGLSVTIDAQSEDDTQTLATPSYPTTQDLFHDGELTVSVNSTPFFTKSSSLKIDRKLDVTRRGQHGSTLKKEPLKSALTEITGDLQGEFEDLTTFNLFKNGTIVPIVFDWVGPIINTTYAWELKLTMPACRLDGPMPETKGPGILDADTPFTVLYDGTDEPITVLLRTTDATA